MCNDGIGYTSFESHELILEHASGLWFSFTKRKLPLNSTNGMSSGSGGRSSLPDTLEQINVHPPDRERPGSVTCQVSQRASRAFCSGCYDAPPKGL